jgi:nucleoside-diphosphate-sugar epimerase
MDGAILVTGASGFVGRHLVTTLGRLGKRVRAGVRRPVPEISSANVETVLLPDYTSQVDWPKFLAGVDLVVHAAGIAHAGSTISASVYDQINAQTTADLARASAQAGIGRLVFMSSIRAQVGPFADHVLTEGDQPHPTDNYGRSKLMAEAAVRDSSVRYTILRPVGVYGPGVKGNIASLIWLARSPLPLPFAGLQNRRSLVAIDNLIAAIRFVLDDPRTVNETYIVADREAMTLAEIIATLRAGAGRSPNMFSVPPALVAGAFTMIGRPDFWSRLGGTLLAMPSKLIEAGWQPVVDASTGLTQVARASAERRSG